MENNLLRQCMYDISDEITALASLIEALSCTNVTFQKKNNVSEAVNRKRVRKGKSPIYQTYELIIKNNNTKASAENTYTHSSPSMHLRRGHIRRHVTAGKIWVNACVVGSAKDGVINKSYKLLRCSNDESIS